MTETGATLHAADSIALMGHPVSPYGKRLSTSASEEMQNDWTREKKDSCIQTRL